MQSSSIPVKIPVTWAASAPGGDITYPIPVPSQISITPGRASFTDGFPPDNFLPPAGGGVPPFGQDFNGIISQITRWVQWQNAGAAVPYDATFQSAVGGYPKGAVVASPVTFGVWWLSTAENNTSDPDTGGANWVNYFYNGIVGLAAGGVLVGTYPNPSGLAATGVTAGSYTSPTITVGADGRLTAVASGTEPTYTTLKTGTAATYTTPAGVKRLKIRMMGGAGSGALPSTAGGNGTQSAFGSTTALFGHGGNTVTAGVGGIGGTGGVTGTGTEILRLAGGQGNGNFSVNVVAGGTTVNISGAPGASSPFGGAGVGGPGNGVNAVANTGSGGAGSNYEAGSIGNFTGPGGGGAGEYVEFFINAPASTYTYTVGLGGTAPSGAGNGGSGLIEIEEFYT